jgi:hypothetical protein
MKIMSIMKIKKVDDESNENNLKDWFKEIIRKHNIKENHIVKTRKS